VRDIGRDELRPPAAVFDVDLSTTYGVERVDVTHYQTAWCLVRRNTVGVAVRFLDIGDRSALTLAELRDHFAGKDLPEPVVATDSVNSSLTVVICTRDRAEGLHRTLTSLRKQADKSFDVVVIDNSRERDIADSLTDFPGLNLRCYHEPLPGLSRARNRALGEELGDLVAWIDDDEVADPEWITWLKRGFASPHRPDAVVGVMLPAELETSAQVDWERYGGFNKGRGMEPTVLRAGAPPVVDPLYPRPIFGSGGNMAMRTAALRAIGGFENRLGAGTLTKGGEDTQAFSRLLQTGSAILHWPPAITWHYHRRTDAALESQLFGNSAGLTSFYMSSLLASPRNAWRILGFVPREVRAMLKNGRRRGQNPLPERLFRASHKGLWRGPWLYVREAFRQRNS
jgi:GT2 family glycosyltransferase